MNNEEVSLKELKFDRRYTLEECMSDLSIINKSLHCLAAVSVIEKKGIQEKRMELHIVKQKINDMKNFCSRTSDLVFRSLCGAQKEGGHALVSSRSRVLALNGKAGRINLERDYSHDSKGVGREENFLSMTFSELLIVSKEIRVVEKFATKVTRMFDFDNSAKEEGREIAVEDVIFL